MLYNDITRIKEIRSYIDNVCTLHRLNLNNSQEQYLSSITMQPGSVNQDLVY